MASTNVDLVRSIYAAWERGDYFSSTEWADPELELVIPEGAVGLTEGPQRRSAKGLAAVGEAWSDFLRSWEDWRVVVEEYRELDDERVLVLLHNSGRGRRSGVEAAQITAKVANVLRIRDGKVVELVLYADRDRALADLGLKESAMSQENVELIERFFELYNRREIDAWVGMMAPDLEWHVDPEDPDTTVHRGPEAAKRYGLTWAEMMDATIEVREIFEASDDQAVAWTRVESRGGLSGAAAGQDYAFIFNLRDGLVVRVQETQDKREALEAVGLTEQDAHADSS